MDEGRIAGTDEVWDATEIRHESQVNGVDWRCPCCHARVYAAAWDTSQRHKVTAHFKRYRLQSHDPGCLYLEVANAGPEALAWSEMGTPREWIDRIDFPTPAAPMQRQQGDGPPHIAIVHSSTRHSLTGACRFHYSIKGDRWDWKLKVAGVPGSTYFDVFEPLFKRPPENATRIWFGDLFFMEAPIETDSTIEIAIAGHIKVVAETGNWSDFQKSVLLSRVHDARRRARVPKTPKPQVYVLSNRDPQTPDVVRFRDPRKFALILP